MPADLLLDPGAGAVPPGGTEQVSKAAKKKNKKKEKTKQEAGAEAAGAEAGPGSDEENGVEAHHSATENGVEAHQETAETLDSAVVPSAEPQKDVEPSTVQTLEPANGIEEPSAEKESPQKPSAGMNSLQEPSPVPHYQTAAVAGIPDADAEQITSDPADQAASSPALDEQAAQGPEHAVSDPALEEPFTESAQEPTQPTEPLQTVSAKQATEQAATLEPIQSPRSPAAAASTPPADVASPPAAQEQVMPESVAQPEGASPPPKLSKESLTASATPSSKPVTPDSAMKSGGPEAGPVASTAEPLTPPSAAAAAASEPVSSSPSVKDLSRRLAEQAEKQPSYKPAPSSMVSPSSKPSPAKLSPAPASPQPASPQPAAAPSAAPSGLKDLPVVKAPRVSGTPSPHDVRNTINAAQLLKLGAFKLQPLKDFIPYEELLTLRLEDGIDPTRKPDYLTEEEFEKVFGLTRDEFAKLPAWRQASVKKKVNLF